MFANMKKSGDIKTWMDWKMYYLTFLNRFRTILHYFVIKFSTSNMKINFCVLKLVTTPFRQQPPSSTFAQTLKTIIVKPKNAAQTAAKTKTDILSNLNPIIDSDLDVKVKSIKDAGVLVKCSDPEGEFKKFVSKENIKENYDIRQFMMVILQRLRISDISNDIQEEYIPSLLIKQNKHFFY
jgi:hypothetical protein